MKKKLLFTLFVLMSFNSSYAQEVFYLHAIKISDSEVENFENIQREYVTELAQEVHTHPTLSEVVEVAYKQAASMIK